ncbi:RNase H domain-containing protein [Trichonephila clavipes]|nr:RNase H domain-containing protein [Trichonephila clavipes]
MAAMIIGCDTIPDDSTDVVESKADVLKAAVSLTPPLSSVVKWWKQPLLPTPLHTCVCTLPEMTYCSVLPPNFTRSDNAIRFKVFQLPIRHSIYIQWVPSHIVLSGNEIADSLAKSATTDALRGDACLTFDELSSIKRTELNALWRVTPAHPWYFGRNPRWCHQLNIPKDRKTAISRFFRGHIKYLTFEHLQKVFPECNK